MSNQPKSPVIFIEELNEITVTGNRAIVSFDSLGAEVRLTLSAKTLMLLCSQGRDAANEIFDDQAQRATYCASTIWNNKRIGKD